MNNQHTKSEEPASKREGSSGSSCNDLLHAVSQSEFAILDHTINRASCGLFCGYSDDMQRLVAAGLMEFAGRKSFVPDSYFRITSCGREAWAANRPPDPPREKISAKKRRARERYDRFIRADSGLTFGEWIKSGM